MPSSYYLKNRDRILERNKIYRQVNKGTIDRWRRKNHSRISEYNKEKYNTDPLFRDDHRESSLYSYYRRRLACMDSDDPRYRETYTRMVMHKELLDEIRKIKKEKRGKDNA